MANKEVFQKREYKDLSIEEKTAIQLEKLRQIPSKKFLIDGLAGVGKGTLVEKLAEDLGLKQIKTGDMYRVITWYLLSSGFDASQIQNMSEAELKDNLSGIKIEFEAEDSSWWVNHPNIKYTICLDSHLRSPEVDGAVSKVACRDAVRDIVDERLKEIVRTNDNVVSEGRDMYQVFAEDRTGLTMIYMYASERDLMLREKGRQLEVNKKEIGIYESAKVLRRNEDDNQKERGKLLLPGEVHAGNYDLVINNSGLRKEETYLLVLESLFILNQVQTKIEEMMTVREQYFAVIDSLSEEEKKDMVDLFIFIASQWGMVSELMEEFAKKGDRNVGEFLLSKLDLYMQSLQSFF